jgi:hypothetical protein
MKPRNSCAVAHVRNIEMTIKVVYLRSKRMVILYGHPLGGRRKMRKIANNTPKTCIYAFFFVPLQPQSGYLD